MISAANFTVTAPGIPDIYGTPQLWTDNPLQSWTVEIDPREARGTLEIFYDDKRYQITIPADGLITWTPPYRVEDGQYAVSFRITDGAGNSGDPVIYIYNVDTTPPEKPKLLQIYDNVGRTQGNLNPGDTTDDTQPLLRGSATPGDTILIYDGTTLIGSVLSAMDGSWEYAPQLSEKQYEFSVEASDRFGRTSGKSAVFPLTIDTHTDPDQARISFAIDDFGPAQGVLFNGATTDDLTPTLSGDATPGTLVWIQYHIEGTSTMRVASIRAEANGQWQFTPPNLAAGNWVFYAGNAADNVDYANGFHLSLVSTSALSVSILQAIDDFGPYQGVLSHNAITDDATPQLQGKAEANSVVYIAVRGGNAQLKILGSVSTDESGNWTYDVPAQGYGNWNFYAGYSLSKLDLTHPFSLTIAHTNTIQPVIDYALDNFGADQGVIRNNDQTDDPTPELHGKAEANSLIFIRYGLRGAINEIASVMADSTGKWQWTPTLTGSGQWLFSTSYDVSFLTHNDFTMTLTNDIDKPRITHGYDDYYYKHFIENNGVTNDSTPTLYGTAKAGQSLQVQLWSKDTGNWITFGHVRADSYGNWSFTSPRLSNAGVYEFRVKPASGGESASDSFTLSYAASVAAPTLLYAIDDQGARIGEIVKGATTDDRALTLEGKGSYGSHIEMEYRLAGNNQWISGGSAVVNNNGFWSLDAPEVTKTGVWEYRVRATNGDNYSSWSAIFNVTVIGRGERVGEDFSAYPTGAFTDLDGEHFMLRTLNPGTYGKPAINSAKQLVLTDYRGNSDNSLVEVAIKSPATAIGFDAQVFKPLTNAGWFDVIIYLSDGSARTFSLLSGESDYLSRSAFNSTWGTFNFNAPEGLTITHYVFNTDNNANWTNTWLLDNFTFQYVSQSEPEILYSYDSAGLHTGITGSGMETDDRQPTLYGKASAWQYVWIRYGKAGEAGYQLTAVQADKNGEWYFEAPLSSSGEWQFFAGSSPESVDQAAPFTLIVTDHLESARIHFAIDDYGSRMGSISDGQSTNDATPVLKGSGTPGDQIMVQYRLKDSPYWVNAGVARVNHLGEWSFQSPQLKVNGVWEYRVQGGSAESAWSEPFTLGYASSSITPSISVLVDDVGSHREGIVRNGISDDTTPVLEGRGTPGSTIEIHYKSGGNTWIPAGTVLVNNLGFWTFESPELHKTGVWQYQVRATYGDGYTGWSAPYQFTLIDGRDWKTEDFSTFTTGRFLQAESDLFTISTNGGTGSNHPAINASKQLVITDARNHSDHALTYIDLKQAASSVSFDATLFANVYTGSLFQLTLTLSDNSTRHFNLLGGESDYIKRESLSSVWGTFTFDAPEGLSVSQLTFTTDNSNYYYYAQTYTLDNFRFLTTGAAATIEWAEDDAGRIQDNLISGDTTDDLTPVLHGKADAYAWVWISYSLADGSLPAIASIQADVTGSWTWQATLPAEGTWHFTARNSPDETVLTPPFALHVDGSREHTRISHALDNYGVSSYITDHGVTNDKTLLLKGTGVPGEWVEIRRALSEKGNWLTIGTAVVDATGHWQLQSPQLNQYGLWEYQVKSGAGEWSETFTVSYSLTAYAASIDYIVADNEGYVQPINPGGITQDRSPVLTGRGPVGTHIEIEYNRGGNKWIKAGQAVVNNDGQWQFESPELDKTGVWNYRVRSTNGEAYSSYSAVRSIKLEAQGEWLREDFTGFRSGAFTETQGELFTLRVIDGVNATNKPQITSDKKLLLIDTTRAFDYSQTEMVLHQPAGSLSFDASGFSSSNANAWFRVFLRFSDGTEEQFDLKGKETSWFTREALNSSWGNFYYAAAPGKLITSVVFDTNNTSYSAQYWYLDNFKFAPPAWNLLESHDWVTLNGLTVEAGEALTLTALLERAGQQGETKANQIDLTDGKAQTLTLSVDDLIRHGEKSLLVDDGKLQLVIQGDAADTITLDSLSDGAVSGWQQQQGVVEVAGVQYHAYRHQSDLIETLIQKEVTVV